MQRLEHNNHQGADTATATIASVHKQVRVRPLSEKELCIVHVTKERRHDLLCVGRRSGCWRSLVVRGFDITKDIPASVVQVRICVTV